ncbi:hypothetical protein GHT09_017066 [Marmota monax]|uniref:Uncharacterized protein n=1 Tax=Marmota monax TaxID=9995 RepID=A0A834Q315_MARMO|nr:hypothetical protein GHT09_017066 [Marmota monax]
MPMQDSRTQHQSRSPNSSTTQDYQVPKQDHWHQHLGKTFGHPPKQKSWAPLPRRTPGSYPRAGTPATTPMWTPIYQCGAPLVTSILGLCSNGDIPLHRVACLHLGISHRL